MKIILATGIFPPDIGGTATYSEKLAKELAERGISIEVICYSDVKKYGEYGFKVIRISRRLPKIVRHCWYFLKLLFLAKRADLIFVLNPISAGLPAALAAKILRKRLILKVVSDGAWEQYITNLPKYDSPEEFQRKRYGLKTEILRKIQRFSANSALKIIVPSLYVKGTVIAWGVNPAKIEVVYNALRPSIPLALTKEEAKSKLGLEGAILLSVGRLSPEKGFATIIEALPGLLQKNPGFKLLIAGDGETRQELEAKIKDLGLEGKVKMAGQVPAKDIPLYFKAADLFILVSQGEGLPHVILEAMQFGVPIIASRHGGNTEVVEHGLNGLLVEYQNAGQLKEAVWQLWQDKAMQQKFIQESFEKIKEFDWELLMEKTLNILKTA